jgi:uncharacterized membrane protein
MLLLLPTIMILIGILFMKFPPKKINHVYGYRTAMSMKNLDTWRFAHAHCGRLWMIAGLALLPLSAVLLLVLQNEPDLGFFGVAYMILQAVLIFIPIILTEKALNKHFDKHGKRLNPIK